MLCGWGTWQFSSGRSRGGAWGACPPPTYLRVWMTPPTPPLFSRSGSGTVYWLISNVLKLINNNLIKKIQRLIMFNKCLEIG